MLARIKSRLGMGKTSIQVKYSVDNGSSASTYATQSATGELNESIPKLSPIADVPPATANLQAGDGSTGVDDSGVITRERIGRVSNRLSKRAEMMRNQTSGSKSLLSQSLRTLESVASTGSQADYFTKGQSILIFDWDDTLCPSHWIRINRPKLQYFQPCPDDPRYKQPLEALSDQVIKVLRSSSEIAKTVILTNAQVGWVQISCQNFMPRVWPVIQELNIDIVYARQSVEQDVATCRDLDYNYNANAPQLWKERAMQDNISRFYSQYLHQSWKNIISIGDQVCEHNACRIVALARPSKKRCRTKTVKLVEEPSIENLIAENQVILQWLTGLVQFDGDLNVDLSHDDDVLLDLHDLLARK